ncbi:MAG: AAA family ATPase [Solirubrobacteraceae bacterium]
MPGLIVVTGPPGAGKSTVAEILAKRVEPSALVASDTFFAMIDRGFIDPWTEAAHHQNGVVIAAAAAAAGRMTDGGFTVVFDGVIGPWFLDAFLAATGLGEIHYVMLLPPERICLQRVSSRVGHGFSDSDAARHMYRAFAVAARSDLCVVRSTDSPDLVAGKISELLETAALRIPIAAAP